jgi:hypothetical protein
LQVSTGTRPPDAASVDQLPLILVQFAFGDFSSAILMVRVASRTAEMSSRTSHFFRTIPLKI